jgi:hypothetical protein
MYLCYPELVEGCGELPILIGCIGSIEIPHRIHRHIDTHRELTYQTQQRI